VAADSRDFALLNFSLFTSHPASRIRGTGSRDFALLNFSLFTSDFSLS
jgi:hypothetical protein